MLQANVAPSSPAAPTTAPTTAPTGKDEEEEGGGGGAGTPLPSAPGLDAGAGEAAGVALDDTPHVCWPPAETE